MTSNRYGLNRHIPTSVKREVRRRSKFGCILCRTGFYHYEHIDPTFAEARTHSPDHICCLCASCHDAVTRGHIAKRTIHGKYEEISALQPHEVEPPKGPLDFTDGNAELVIGGLNYAPLVRTVLRYHNEDLITVQPGNRGEPGTISAKFTDSLGRPSLHLKENEWIGSTDSWDIEITSNRLSVSSQTEQTTILLRLDPPGRVVIQALDMRYNDAHVLVSEDTYAVGRVLSNGSLIWAHAGISEILKSTPSGSAIEFTTREALEDRDRKLQGVGQSLRTNDDRIVLHSHGGLMVKPIGVVIAGLCGGFDLTRFCVGQGSLEDVRRVIREDPNQLCAFIAGRAS